MSNYYGNYDTFGEPKSMFSKPVEGRGNDLKDRLEREATAMAELEAFAEKHRVDQPLTREEFEQLGYAVGKRLVSGEWLAVQKMIATAGLFVVTDNIGYRTRYCYEHMHEAVLACMEWNGVGDPPGNWIKEKPSERLGPGATQ